MLGGKLAVAAEGKTLFMENSGAEVAACQLAVLTTDAVRGKHFTKRTSSGGREKGERLGGRGNNSELKKRAKTKNVIGNTVAKHRSRVERRMYEAKEPTGYVFFFSGKAALAL